MMQPRLANEDGPVPIPRFIGAFWRGQLKTFTALPSVKHTGHSYRRHGYPPGPLGTACVPTLSHTCTEFGKMGRRRRRSGDSCPLNGPKGKGTFGGLFTHSGTVTLPDCYDIFQQAAIARYARRECIVASVPFLATTATTTTHERHISKHRHVDMSSENMFGRSNPFLGLSSRHAIHVDFGGAVR